TSGISLIKRDPEADPTSQPAFRALSGDWQGHQKTGNSEDRECGQLPSVNRMWERWHSEPGSLPQDSACDEFVTGLNRAVHELRPRTAGEPDMSHNRLEALALVPPYRSRFGVSPASGRRDIGDQRMRFAEREEDLGRWAECQRVVGNPNRGVPPRTSK